MRITHTFAMLHSIRPTRACHQGFRAEVVEMERVLGASLANHSLSVYEHHRFGECMQAVLSEKSAQPQTEA